jgi:two-component system KDP operon response regulator KdpE
MDSDAPRRAILIVDDYPDIRQATAEVLRLESFDVTEAATGAEGLARLADMDGPCLILLDLELPDMDGYEFHARARALERPHAAPVVLLTGRVEVRLPPGVVGLLQKPFEFQELLDVVHAHAPAR